MNVDLQTYSAAIAVLTMGSVAVSFAGTCQEHFSSSLRCTSTCPLRTLQLGEGRKEMVMQPMATPPFTPYFTKTMAKERHHMDRQFMQSLPVKTTALDWTYSVPLGGKGTAIVTVPPGLVRLVRVISRQEDYTAVAQDLRRMHANNMKLWGEVCLLLAASRCTCCCL